MHTAPEQLEQQRSRMDPDRRVCDYCHAELEGADRLRLRHVECPAVLPVAALDAIEAAHKLVGRP